MTDEKADLPKVLDFYEVVFSPARNRQMVPCPLHEDRTPSMSLHLERGLWKCHSCAQGGDAYTLIEKMEKIPFARAAEFAAAKHLTEGSAGGGDERLSGSSYGGRRHVAQRKGPDGRGGGWRPSWRSR